jgi:diaminohydroxyphosphoribosylaminopyrimidine deaminase/5-amino-6-(5-phosphoribosylamino)uracil reductase
MQRCLELAKRGAGFVNPNPFVGCVIVYQDKIISEGWHTVFGQDHAERMAILQLSDKTVLKDSTVYVNLEPCAHFGKTPPCANLLIEHKVKRVVVGMKDPNTLVAGKGIAMLHESGIEVVENVLNQECLELNKFFVTFHTQKRPYIILKWAECVNQLMAPLPKAKYQISGPETTPITHSLRRDVSAIMVGVNTWNIDNPQLDNRLYSGNSPRRFVIDKALKGNYSKEFVGNSAVYVVNSIKNDVVGNVHYINMNFDQLGMKNLLDLLFQQNINSLMVEGGAFTLNELIKNNLFDEIHRLKSKKMELKQGILAPNVMGNRIKSMELPNDFYDVFKNSTIV